MTRLVLVAILAIVAIADAIRPAAAADPLPAWDEIVAEARGQTVYWNAWGGSDRTNDYIAWVKERVAEDYGVTLQHIKLADTAEAVSRVVAEKVSGRTEGGSVDLIWINGENFAAMKAQDLLFGPFTQVTPNYDLVDTEGKPTTLFDFTVPVDGLEAPWGMAQIVFLYDTAYVEDPPRSMPAFLDWARAHPGRFTYSQPPDFTGSTFLKQALYELATDRDALQKPATAEIFATVTAPLWNWLDALHPHLWRDGQTFPQNAEVQRQMLDDGVIDLSLSFYPSDASSAIARGLLPDTVRTYVLDGGTIGNTHFVAIPFNASAKEGAMVVANFLMSPEAQLHKQDPEVWGDQTVLAMSKLDPADRKRFEELPRGVATLAPEELGKVLLEPHPSWMTRLEAEWRRRYGH
jgi:putative thiamine transport system substrate-binding protein